VDLAIYELFYFAVTDSFSGDFVWPHVVLVTEGMPYERGASVFDLGALAFLVYSLGSATVLTHCNTISIHVVDLMKGRDMDT